MEQSRHTYRYPKRQPILVVSNLGSPGAGFEVGLKLCYVLFSLEVLHVYTRMRDHCDADSAQYLIAHGFAVTLSGLLSLLAVLAAPFVVTTLANVSQYPLLLPLPSHPIQEKNDLPHEYQIQWERESRPRDRRRHDLQYVCSSVVTKTHL